MKIKKICAIIAFSIIILFLSSFFSGCLESDGKAEYATNFEYTSIDNSKKQLSDFQGKILLIDFFGATCGPCQYQMLELINVYENYKEKNLEILSIDVWIIQGETLDMVKQFVSDAKSQGYYLNWSFGADDTRGTLARRYANSGVPKLLLLDKNGNIYETWTGYTEYSAITKKLDELI